MRIFFSDPTLPNSQLFIVATQSNGPDGVLGDVSASNGRRKIARSFCTGLPPRLDATGRSSLPAEVAVVCIAGIDLPSAALFSPAFPFREISESPERVRLSPLGETVANRLPRRRSARVKILPGRVSRVNFDSGGWNATRNGKSFVSAAIRGRAASARSSYRCCR